MCVFCACALDWQVRPVLSLFATIDHRYLDGADVSGLLVGTHTPPPLSRPLHTPPPSACSGRGEGSAADRSCRLPFLPAHRLVITRWWFVVVEYQGAVLAAVVKAVLSDPKRLDQ